MVRGAERGASFLDEQAEKMLDGLSAPAKKTSEAPGDITPPSPLPKLPDVPEFPLEILPNGLRAWVDDAACRMRFRPEFAAVSSMAALGSVIGRKLGIRLKQRDDWTEYANVWGALVGQPSTLKSPAMRNALSPFKALQEAANVRYQGELAEYENQSEAFKLRRTAKKKAASDALAKDPDARIDLSGDEPVRPVPRAYWTSDATAEKLGELLAENPTGLLVERDELSALLVKLEDETQATARGLYLSGWSGNESYRFDRIGRGTTPIPKFALSVVGGIQPGPLARYVRGAFAGERADGLLQRFQLIVWPDATSFEYVDRYPDKAAKDEAKAIFQYADTFDPESIGGHDSFDSNQPPYIRLSGAAQGLWVEWYTEFMRELRGVEECENTPLAAHLGKYPGLVGKLALILHVVDNPGAREVSESAMMKALGWIQYLTPHARRVYHAVEHPETGAAELLLSRLKRGELPPVFAARDIYRKGWHGLSESASVKKACFLLRDYGWLVELPLEGGTAGRPADTVYAVSPLAKEIAP
jgi:putative DNA primase/helicase